MTDEVVEETQAEAELSLDDIFNGGEVESEPVAAAETPEPEEAPEQADEAEDTTGDKPDDDASPALETAEKSVPLKALEAERQKRQELEKRLSELERTKEEPKPLPDPLDDAEGFAARMQADFRKELSATRIEMAQDLMRTLHDDYDVREAEFLAAVKENPELIGKFNQASNPAKYAYETALRLEKLNRLDDVDQTEADLRAKIEAELRAKFEAEHKQKAAKDKAVEDADMPSLARTGAGGMSDAEVSLEQAFGGADPSQRKR